MASKYAFRVEDHEYFYRHPEQYRVKPFRILGNLYYVGNADVCSHLIDTGDGLILIDTGYPTTDTLLIQSIWEMGFRPEDIKIILHSHGHFDHFGATDFLKSISGAKTYLGAGDAWAFREHPERALCDCTRYSYLEPFHPDVELNDGDDICLGNTVIHTVSTPGHSDGVISMFFDVEEGGKTYRAAMHGGSGLNTMCREFMEQYGNTTCREDFLAGLKKVENEKVDIMLGNHAPQNDTLGKRKKMLKNPDGPNPFIDPTEWKRFLDSRREALAQLIEDERTGRDQLPENP